MVYIYDKVTPVKRTTTRKLQETNLICKFDLILLQYISFTIRRLAIYLEYCFMKNPAQPWCIFYKSRNTKNRNRNISPFNVICFQIKLEPTPRFLLAQNSEYVAYLQAYTLLFSEQKQSCIMIDSTSKKNQFII